MKLYRILALVLMSPFTVIVHAIEAEEREQGQKAFETLCSSCHNSHTPHEQRIAPPMFAIQKRYRSAAATESGFINNITRFVMSPSRENSKLPGAVKKYGLMPPMGFSEEMIRPIAKFLYHVDMQKPAGFNQHHKQQAASGSDNKKDLQTGQQHALAAKAVLGKNLMTQLQSGGAEAALQFCNEKAIDLTQSVSEQRQVKIKRVSDLNRNPDNQANDEQLAYINSIKDKLKSGEPIAGQITNNESTMIGYYPILTNDMCLQCHGVPNQDIAADTLNKIKQLYPNDKAKGYGPNELRGIWVVEMGLKE